MERGWTVYAPRLRRWEETAENIGSGDYEIETSHLETSDRLFEQHPDAVIATLRIGYPATFSRGVQCVRALLHYKVTVLT